MLDVRISRSFRDFQLDVAFSTEGQTVVLFGPSGAGKSVTLRSIAGIVTPDAGRIEVEGRLLYDSALGVNLPPQQRRVGYVPQRYALFPHLTVAENVAFGLRGLSAEAKRARVVQMLDVMGLHELDGHRPQELSGGQQQRVALARAMAFQPDILLLDEPFGALDAGIRSELRQGLLALRQASSVTLVMVTHDLGEAFLLGEKIVVLDKGRVLQSGSREDVFYRPQSRRVAELVGIGNILRGSIRSSQGGSLELDWRQVRLRVASNLQLMPGSEVDFCIRPTQIMIRPANRDGYERENAFCGDIVEEVVGAEMHRLFIRLDRSQARYDLEIELPGYVYFRLGLDTRKRIEMSVRPEMIHVIAPAGV
ncbi:MAG TPA: ABC transporter ATP-binding protein [Dehalococcoidia bacterium]|nr:ABC transporter ATP-binding protein [Dehalococcoidia bacterium]